MDHDRDHATDLRDRWADLTRRLAIERDQTAGIRDDLLARYGEAHRAYHDLSHIAQCLGELDSARDLAGDDTAVELALWYHDAIYDPRANDNERRSAALFLDQATRLGLADDKRRHVARMIEATAHGQTGPDAGAAPDTALLLDIDLSILGQAEPVFDRYEEGVRFEYTWVEPERFIAGRRRILVSFLARDRLFATAHFRSRYEVTARRNLARALAALDAAA